MEPKFSTSTPFSVLYIHHKIMKTSSTPPSRDFQCQICEVDSSMVAHLESLLKWSIAHAKNSKVRGHFFKINTPSNPTSYLAKLITPTVSRFRSARQLKLNEHYSAKRA